MHIHVGESITLTVLNAQIHTRTATYTQSTEQNSIVFLKIIMTIVNNAPRLFNILMLTNTLSFYLSPLYI